MISTIRNTAALAFALALLAGTALAAGGAPGSLNGSGSGMNAEGGTTGASGDLNGSGSGMNAEGSTVGHSSAELPNNDASTPINNSATGVTGTHQPRARSLEPGRPTIPNGLKDNQTIQ